MKKLFLFITLLATFVACSKSEDGAENNNPNNNQGGNIPSSIEVESTDWVIAELGGYYYLDFYASDNWKAFLVNNSDWLSVVSGQGEAGNNKLKILVRENNGEDERRAAIKIVSNTESVTINVTQKMKDALTVTKSKFEVKAEGGNIEVEIKANVEYDFSISESAKSWITHKSTRAMETSTLEFSVAANEDTKRREGKITIYSGNLKETITIYQEGVEPTIVLTQSEYNVSDEENTISVEVTSGVDVHYEIIDDVDWVREITSRAISTTTFKFEIAQNNGYDSRSARIRFYNEGENLEEYVTINQMQKDAIVLAKDSYTIASDGGDIEVGVGHNVDFDVEIGCDWITCRDTRAFVTDKLTFVIDENNDYDDREGTIIFNSKDGTLSQTVKVYQTQRDAIVLAKDSYTITSNGGEVEVGIGHNVDFDVEIGCDWITRRDTRAFVTDKLTFVIDENNDYDDREGTIIFNSKDGTLSQTVKVYQTQRDAIVLAKESYTIASDGGDIEVGVGHNVDFDVEIGCDWITQTSTRALENETLMFTIAANSSTDDREGIINFNSKDGVISQSVSIIQGGRDLAANEIVIEFDSPTYYSEDEVNAMLANSFGVSISSYSYSDGVCVITLNDTCTAIPNRAFYGRYGIKKVMLGENITSIKSSAFRSCGIKVIFMKNVKTIDDYAFAGSGLFDVELPNTLETIGNSVFDSAWQLTHIYIPNSVSKIGEGVFYNCALLESITFDADNVEFTGDYRLFMGCENLSAFYGKCASEDNRCLIVDGNLIGFAPYGLRKYDIPNSVTTIGDYAFSECNALTSVTIPNSVTTIGDYAFSECNALTSVTIPNSVTTIGDYAFYYCTDLSRLTIPDSVTTIGNAAFYDCDTLSSVTIGSGVTVIGHKAFASCSDLASVIIPDSVTTIGDSAFSFCFDLASVTIGSGVTVIGDEAFRGCEALTSVIIPDSVTTIGNEAFSGCDALTSVTIGSGVTSIGKSPFIYSWSLKKVYCKPVEIPYGLDDTTFMLSDDWYVPTVYVPVESLERYRLRIYDQKIEILGYYF